MCRPFARRKTQVTFLQQAPRSILGEQACTKAWSYAHDADMPPGTKLSYSGERKLHVWCRQPVSKLSSDVVMSRGEAKSACPKGEENRVSQRTKGDSGMLKRLIKSLDQELIVFMSHAQRFHRASPRSHGIARRSNKCSTLVIMLVTREEEDLRGWWHAMSRQSVSKWWCGVVVVMVEGGEVTARVEQTLQLRQSKSQR